MRKMLLGAVALSMVYSSAVSADPYTLTTGTGDGKVTVGVDGYGSFGSAVGSNATNAVYDPVGSVAAAGTTYQSALALRIGNAGGRSFLSTGTLGSSVPLSTNPTIAGTSTSGASAFTFGGLAFSLAQSVSNISSSGTQTGSRLDQVYTITNTTASSLTFQLVRYFDGDLTFDGGINDGGGLIEGTTRTLFETDSATGSSSSTTFVGITGIGGTQSGFEVASFSGLRSRVLGGTDLANVIMGDGTDSDTFIDAGSGYDVTLALSNDFTLGVGQSTTYTTQTIFGTGAPDTFVPPVAGAAPEPATWGMMILGFGVVGGALRRRQVTTSISYAA